MKAKYWKAGFVIAGLLAFICLIIWSVTGLLSQVRAMQQNSALSRSIYPDSLLFSRNDAKQVTDSVFAKLVELDQKVDILNVRFRHARDTVFFVSTVAPDSVPSFGVYYPAVIPPAEEIKETAPAILQYRRDAAGFLVWTGNSVPLRIPLTETVKLPWYRYFYFPISFSAYGNSDVGAAAGIGFKHGAVMFGATTAGREIRVVYNAGGPFAR